ncbi:hypothetical protein WA026_009699 [Henosepilachna vigintioctopunctata]|uniref:Uncharacterized protein n=1 Tax=Henosepilachna vigintioctopunctata TaxID=420089 RepID=A0AAW1U6Y4_9CUCU
MEKTEFEGFVRKKKKGRMYDKDLLTEMRKLFASGKRKIDTQRLVSEYMKLYPDTVLPPAPKKKDVTPTTASTTETKPDKLESRVSFSTQPDKIRSPGGSSKTSIKKRSSQTINESNLMQENQTKLPDAAEQQNELTSEATTSVDVQRSSQSAIVEEVQAVTSLTVLDEMKSTEKVRSVVKINEEVHIYNESN